MATHLVSAMNVDEGLAENTAHGRLREEFGLETAKRLTTLHGNSNEAENGEP